MPLNLYPVQLPQSPEGKNRVPLLLLFDGSGLAYEYNALKPLDRLIYGVSIAPDGGQDQEKAAKYLSREFGTIDVYIDQLVHLLETEIFDENGDDSDSDDDSDDDSEDSDEDKREVLKVPPSLWLGGFSAGGFFAIELARRLLSCPIKPAGASEPVKVTIPGVVLLDCFNPSAPEVRITFQNFLNKLEDEDIFLPSFDRYLNDNPIIHFIRAHLIHCTKLSIAYDLGPFPADVRKTSPVVHLLRAADRSSEPRSRDHLNYWSKELLPTLDLSTTKTVENSGHFELWHTGKVEQVTEWLGSVLSC